MPVCTLAPATPIAYGLSVDALKEAKLHTGLSEIELKSSYTQVELGELKFLTKKLAIGSGDDKPEVTESEVAAAGGAGSSSLPWKASLLLSEYIREHPQLTVDGKRVLNLSAGIGAVGFAMAESGAKAVTMTDAEDDTVGVLHTNKHLNKAWLTTKESDLHIAQLDVKAGDAAVTAAQIVSNFGPFDTLVASDALHTPADADALAQLLNTPAIAGAHELLVATEVHYAGAGKDGALGAFLAAMATAGWGWSASRLHKTEHAFAMHHSKPFEEDIHAKPNPDDVVARIRAPSVDLHVEAVALHALGPGAITETEAGAPLAPTAAELEERLEGPEPGSPAVTAGGSSGPDAAAAAAAAARGAAAAAATEPCLDPHASSFGQDVAKPASVAEGEVVLLRMRRI